MTDSETRWIPRLRGFEQREGPIDPQCHAAVATREALAMGSFRRSTRAYLSDQHAVVFQFDSARQDHRKPSSAALGNFQPEFQQKGIELPAFRQTSSGQRDWTSLRPRHHREPKAVPDVKPIAERVARFKSVQRGTGAQNSIARPACGPCRSKEQYLAERAEAERQARASM